LYATIKNWVAQFKHGDFFERKPPWGGKFIKVVFFLHEYIPAHQALATQKTGQPELPVS